MDTAEKTVQDFGREWKHFNQQYLTSDESQAIFDKYFKIFPRDVLNKESVGIDIGCGSGRWAKRIATKVKQLYCLDASIDALEVAKENLSCHPNVKFLHASIEKIPVGDETLDFAYALGVIHHIKNADNSVKSVVKKLKIGAPFLVYVYYAFDNKPGWFQLIWKISNYLRKVISVLPFSIKLILTQLIAVTVYFPLARFSLLLTYFGIDVSHFPLSAYRNRSFYTMRTDALDRFGTRIENRFSKMQLIEMLERVGLKNIRVSDDEPYWCAIGYRQ